MKSPSSAASSSIMFLFALLISTATATPLLTEARSPAPTASAKPSATCSYIEKSPLPTARHCDVQGRLFKHNAPFASPHGHSEAACLNHCLSSKAEHNTTCKAFAHDLTQNRCDLYNTSIDAAGHFVASRSNVWFWSLQCFEEECTKSTGNHSSSTFSTTLAPSSTPTGTATVNGTTTATSSVSAPVTTVSKGGHQCTIPLPLSVYDCKSIVMPIANSGYLATYSLYFNGTSVTENPTNPGNPPNALMSPQATILPGLDTGCNAAAMCAGAASGGGIGETYMSFDLHYDLKKCKWVCVMYGGVNTNASYFDVVDKEAYRTHGFSATMKKVLAEEVGEESQGEGVMYG